jgi:nitroimidazol reductase NimA-like FMN-containing flavoprotein (pyridoxamine 5'-phosphate oxidase superfamily)
MSKSREDYPQPPRIIEGELIPFLERAPIARLATHNPDGTTHIAPVWFKYVDGHILIPTQEKTRKSQNILRNPDVSVLIDTQEPPYTGVLIYGEGQLDYDQIFEKKLDIYRKYFPEDQLPDPYKLAEKFAPIVLRIIPKRIVTFDERG